jgi:type IV pilus assembly protein PilP
MKRSVNYMLVVATLALTACQSDKPDLKQWVSRVESQSDFQVEPPPQIKTPDSVTYTASDKRDPYRPVMPEQPKNVVEGPRPNPERPRDPLEGFELKSLQYVGWMADMALVRTPDGVVWRVEKGRYLGKNDGRVVDYDANILRLEELYPDGMGGWEARQTEMLLHEPGVK